MMTPSAKVFTALLIASQALFLGALVSTVETFHRDIVIPLHEPRRVQLDSYLDHPRPFIALGSSQTNMSLDIDSSDFYNLAWRGEAIAEQWLKLRIVLRQAPGTLRAIFLEVNAPLMLSAGTKNPIFYYSDYVTSDDLEVFRQSGVTYQTPFLTQIDSDYRRQLLDLLGRRIAGQSLAPDPNDLHYKIEPNGYSYNIVLNRSFPSPIAPWVHEPAVHPHFDFFFRRILQEAKAHGIEVVLISTPMFKTLRAAVSPAIWQAVHAYIDKVRAEDGLRYFDFTAYSDDPHDFWNEDHMSREGARKFGLFASALLLPASGKLSVGSGNIIERSSDSHRTSEIKRPPG